jgi:ABC-type multidrug transport system fused ATPase/permease subunit
MKSTLLKLHSLIDRDTKLQLLLLLIPMTIVSLLEMMSIGLVLPVVQIMLPDNTFSLGIPYLDQLASTINPDKLTLWVLVFYAFFFTVKSILYISMVYSINRTIQAKMAQFLTRLFTIYLSRPLSIHFQRNTADVLRDIVFGSGHTFATIRQSLIIALDLMIMFAAIALLIVIHPLITAVASACLFFSAIIFYKLFGPAFLQWGARIKYSEGELIKWVNQSLLSIRITKLVGAYDYFSDKIEEHADERAKATASSETSVHIPRLVFESLLVVGVVIMILFFRKQELPTDEIVGILGLFAMAAMRLLPSISRITTNFTQIKQHIPYIDNLYKEWTEGLKDSQYTTQVYSLHRIKLLESIKLRNIRYAYTSETEENRCALNNFSLDVKKGESVGFVGPSGAGKSTLIDIILGLHVPQSGQMLIDNKNAFENISDWQRNIGFVPQQIFVLDDTIGRNIAFGIKDENIDEDRLLEVLKLAQLDDFVADLPNGLSTMLGEDGTRLSGGQRQRVAIARALYPDPDILVFDEATSALDNKIEREISQAINNLAGEKTILIVAHRLSTVINCDKLVFMKEGEIEAVGSYEALIKGNEDFRHLAQLENKVSESNGDFTP